MRFALKHIGDILGDIYNLTGCRVGLFDENFNEISAYPSRLCDFCRYIRTVEEVNSACKNCDYSAFNYCKQNKTYIKYNCHLGMCEIIVPILKADRAIAYIMLGQMVVDDKDLLANVMLKLQNYPLDAQKLVESFARVKQTDVQTVSSIVNMLLLYSYHLQQLGGVEKDTLEAQLDEYIAENISGNLEIEELCSKFNLRKTNLHQKTKQIYGTSIAKYIRKVRIERAKELMLNTNLSLAEIAESVGIGDYNYFIKVFKAEVKATPKEFKKNNFTS